MCRCTARIGSQDVGAAVGSWSQVLPQQLQQAAHPPEEGAVVCKALSSSGDRSSSNPCPLLGSDVAAMTCTHYWSSCRQCPAACEQADLSPCTPPNNGPLSLRWVKASFWTPQAVFTQPTPSSPWSLTSKAQASALSSYLPWWASKQISQARECQ